MSSFDDYYTSVIEMENRLQNYAKRSFEVFSPNLVNGKLITDYWNDKIRKSTAAQGIFERTPIQIERDRILYSDGMRKQTEKYHMLFNGSRRIIRNYTTHTMRVAQVARSICKVLKLNQDFAEAIAIGEKIGALSFIHISKNSVDDWIKTKIRESDQLDDVKKKEDSRYSLFRNTTDKAVPRWVDNIVDENIKDRVIANIPIAYGNSAIVNKLYSSGKQSYWMLCVNNFTNENISSSFEPETMYGIWLHNFGEIPKPESFSHEYKDRIGNINKINWSNATYESFVVQYADDITWLIENINDSSNAAKLNNRDYIYKELINNITEPSAVLKEALSSEDPSSLYNYFITEYVYTSKKVLDNLSNEELQDRYLLRQGNERAIFLPSKEVINVMEDITRFLKNHVFDEMRVKNRNKLLGTIVTSCLDLMYDKRESILEKIIEERAMLARLNDEQKNIAKKLTEDNIHRIQLCVDVLNDMGDQEIFDLIGMPSV